MYYEKRIDRNKIIKNMFDLNSLLNSTGGTVVGVAVTPNIGLEVMLIDKKTQRVMKYGHKPLAYNLSARDIEDYNELKTGLTELYADLQIDTKSDVYVVLPNVHFGFISFPPIMVDEAIDNALLSKAEESYIFRRVEPKTAWADVNFKNRTDSRYLAYSSIQITVVDRVIEKIEDLGGKVVGIETSYCAFLRAIHFSGIVADIIDQGKNWNILLINSNNYAIFSLVGENLVDYTEVPLALKSFSHEEAYQAIATSASQILVNYPAQKLLIVSQFDEISAQVLQTQMAVDCEVQILDCNKFIDRPIVETFENITDKEAKKMSLSAIGAASVNISKFPLKLNVLKTGGHMADVTYQEFVVFGKTFGITEQVIAKFFLVASVVLAIIFAIFLAGVIVTNGIIDKKNQEYVSKISTIEQEIIALEGDSSVNVESLIAGIAESNVKAMSFYDSISVDIPKSIWLTSYANKDGEKIRVEGMSLNLGDIYTYFKNLRAITPNSTIRLNKLKMITDMFDDTYDNDSVNSEVKFYSFEIGNYAPTDSVEAPPTQNPQAPKSSSNKNVPFDPLSPFSDKQGDGDDGDGLEPPPDLEPLS